jgi:excisionase family DNA binding protein
MSRSLPSANASDVSRRDGAAGGANQRRAPQPHHRPATDGVSAASAAVASLAGAIVELVRVEVDARVRAALTEQAAVAELMSTADAARYAQVTPRSIRRWLDQGKLRALHAGRELRVRRADLDRLMRAGSRQKAAEVTPEQLAARDFGCD